MKELRKQENIIIADMNRLALDRKSWKNCVEKRNSETCEGKEEQII